jgi:hypothetical protein
LDRGLARQPAGVSGHFGERVPEPVPVAGPNLGTGHSSAFSILEAQLAYVVDAVRALRTTVYNAGGCSSYYLDTNGRNSFSWPWSTPALSRRIKDFDPDSYLAA